MAKHPAKCPRCGTRVEFGDADARITCPGCQAPLTAPHTVTNVQEADPLLGTTLGEFQILELLGRGGMGAVYKGLQPALDRFVAIKVLPERFSSDASFIARFDREARAAAAIEHTNIVQVHTVGEERGCHYIAMQFVDGENLHDMLRREGPLPADRALGIFKQVAAALAEAHACGIVHRDIKPSNILLTSKGIAKVADFGLAKRPDIDVSVTATGAALGTPLYMPPEAAWGQPLDARSDLYSLGATFYHLLAGRPPHQGTSAPELILKHAEQEPPPLREVAPNVPPSLCDIIHRLLAKDPAARYQTADALLAALEHLEVQLRAAESTPTMPMPTGARPGIVGGVSPPRDAPVGGVSSPRERLAERRGAARRRRRRTAILASLTGVAAALTAIAIVVSTRGRVAQPPPGRRSPGEGGSAVTPKPTTSVAVPASKTPTAPRTPPKPEPPPDDDERWTEWEDLFDGKTLGGWRVVDRVHIPGVEGTSKAGKVSVEKGMLVIEEGDPMTAITWTRAFPAQGYEVVVEARRLGEGEGNFCDVMFPVVGGFAGFCVGARDSEAELYYVDREKLRADPLTLEKERWHRLRVRVALGSVEAWVNEHRVFAVSRQRSFDPPGGLDVLRPFSLCTHRAGGGIRSIRLRRLKPGAAEPEERPIYTGPWIKHPEPVLSPGPKGAWDSCLVQHPSVVKIGDTYYMYYLGAATGDGPGQTGVATSKDLVHWTKHPANPILRWEQGKWDHKYAGAADVFRDGAIFRMYYNGGHGRPAGYAESRDGVQWRKPALGLFDHNGSKNNNICLPIGREREWDRDCIGAPQVVKVGGLYHLYYCSSRPREVWKIGHATSADGIHWTKDPANPVLTPGKEGEWDGSSLGAPHVVHRQGRFFMFYSGGAVQETPDFCIGLATSSDGARWRKWRKNPILGSGPAGSLRVARRVQGLGVPCLLGDETGSYLFFTIPTEGGRCWIGLARLGRPPAAEPAPKEMPKPEATKPKPPGKLITIRKDGKGDFKSIQAAIDAAEPGSVVEIQDDGPYNEPVLIPKEKPGLTLRGKEGRWPIITSEGPSRGCEKLIVSRAEGSTVERLALVHSVPTGGYSNALCLQSKRQRARFVLAYMAEPSVVGRWWTVTVEHGGGEAELDHCLVALGGANLGEPTATVSNTVLLSGGFHVNVHTRAVLRNVFATSLFARSDCSVELSRCTIPGQVTLTERPNRAKDSILGSITSQARDVTVEHCDVVGVTLREVGLIRFSGQAKPGKGCFSADPLFVDPTAFDYRLKPTSPCKGKASDGGDIGCRFTPEMLEMLDKARELRKKGIISFGKAPTPKPPATQPPKPKAAEAPLPPSDAEGWTSLFDGKTLGGWEVVAEWPCEGHGPVAVEDGALVLRPGKMYTAVRSKRTFPQNHYELELEVKAIGRVVDKLGSIVFPSPIGRAALVLAAHQGTATGLLLVDGSPPAKNPTITKFRFERECWYTVRLRVTEARIEAWIHDQKIVDLPTRDHKGAAATVGKLGPFAIYTASLGSAAVRSIRLRRLER